MEGRRRLVPWIRPVQMASRTIAYRTELHEGWIGERHPCPDVGITDYDGRVRCVVE